MNLAPGHCSFVRLQRLTSKDNFDNDNFKFGTAKYIIIEGIKIWAQRLSYVGELGYELYVEKSDTKKIFELLIEKGKDFNLSNCGMHTMDIMSMESGFLHWGHDISPEENREMKYYGEIADDDSLIKAGNYQGVIHGSNIQIKQFCSWGFSRCI